MRICKELTGRMKATACVYWVEENVRCVFGCWKGDSIDEFKDRINEQLEDSENRKSFMEFIEVAEYCIKKL